SEIPQKYELLQNYPNPFNPMTKLRFNIPLLRGVAEGRGVLLKVYDVLGKEIAVIVNENLRPGTYEIEWYASNIPSGVYFYSLMTNEFTQTKKMVVLK
ncbi:MAG: T9SS type A sorting domain-containing protein, partial [Ignavibacteria bacterium]|nr:T9SS type A sorting domain-containing protein [Ignavibacteria bacterium]